MRNEDWKNNLFALWCHKVNLSVESKGLLTSSLHIYQVFKSLNSIFNYRHRLLDWKIMYLYVFFLLKSNNLNEALCNNTYETNWGACADDPTTTWLLGDRLCIFTRIVITIGRVRVEKLIRHCFPIWMIKYPWSICDKNVSMTQYP